MRKFSGVHSSSPPHPAATAYRACTFLSGVVYAPADCMVALCECVPNTERQYKKRICDIINCASFFNKRRRFNGSVHGTWRISFSYIGCHDLFSSTLSIRSLSSATISHVFYFVSFDSQSNCLRCFLGGFRAYLAQWTWHSGGSRYQMSYLK